MSDDDLIQAALSSSEWTRQVTSRIVDEFRRERDAERALADDAADLLVSAPTRAAKERWLARYREARK